MEEIVLMHIGECRVASDTDTVLETCLGSCVGVAIYDPLKRIGGMCHILLPDGPEAKKAANPAAYAVSGIPLLLSTFEGLGGDRKRAVLAVAGGASIMAKDAASDLRIGQRNLSAVMEILKRERLAITYKDVGGRLGRVMRLHTRGGQVNIRKSKIPTEAETRLDTGNQWNAEAIRLSILQNSEALKPSSNVAIRALQLTNGDAADITELEQLILQDQVLAASLLREANSAFYGARKVGTISQAITYLGIGTFKKIVMRTCLSDMYSHRIDTYDMEEGAFFYHSVGCARISETIAEATGLAGPETAYLAGLLHDIGKIVIERYCQDHFSRVTEKVFLKDEPFIQAEKEVLGLDHAEIGQHIARTWRLPAELEEAIAFHHQPDATQVIAPLPCIVHLADHICSLTGIGLANDAMSNGLNMEAVNFLKLNEHTVEDILSAVPRIVHQYAP
ncbi:MAG: HDOD domain-containing protein [Desulfobacteraceae bacterium]|nr:HDOD domain-containing protein [Desulfobacteraceae bacterium]